MNIKEKNYWLDTVAEPATGASGASPDKLDVPTLIKRYGREAVKRMYASSLESIDLVERIVNEEGIDCNFSRCGHLEVACKQSHFDHFYTAAARITSEF